MPSLNFASRRVPLLALLATLAWCSPAPAADAPAERPVKVFILAGQSNMEGKAKVALLEHQLTQPATREQFEHLRQGGQWVERDDVWIKFFDRKGKLTVGFGSPGCIGPELEFGNTVGDHYDAQVLLIKTAWGGRSLFRDFRSPSSGLPPGAVLDELLEQARKNRPEATLEDVQQMFGASYRQMLAEIDGTLSNLKDHFPEYDAEGYELAGFVWFQGWNDMINDAYTAEYAENMANFIRDVRRDLDAPDLPFVIGQLGVDGVVENPDPKKVAFKKAQAAVGQLPEFHGTVKVVATDVFWDWTADAVYKKGWREHLDEWNSVGSDWPFHYLGSVKTFSQIGQAFGEAMIQLCEWGAAASWF